MTKPGRNDPCPCGSGRKYKHCCGGIDAKVIPFPGAIGAEEPPFFAALDERTFRERQGTPNLATGVLHDLKAAIGNQDFSSQAEAEAFMADFVERRRNAPVDAFLGVNPDRMYRILYDGIEGTVGFLALLDDIRDADIAAIPLLQATLALLAYLGESGPVKATARGNLPRALVLRWWDEIFGPRESDGTIRALLRPNNEKGTMKQSRMIIRLAGLIKLRSGEFSLTELGRRLYEKGDLGGVYRALFYAAGWAFDWNEECGYLRFFHPFAQQSFAFNLHLLGKLARSWTTRATLVDAWLRAFPDVRADFPEDPEAMDDSFMEDSIGAGLTEIPLQLGLLEIRDGRSFNPDAPPCAYRVTPYFDRLLEFSLPREA